MELGDCFDVEKSVGLYVSDHPLAGIDHILDQAADYSIAELMESEELRDGYHVTVAGLITESMGAARTGMSK